MSTAHFLVEFSFLFHLNGFVWYIIGFIGVSWAICIYKYIFIYVKDQSGIVCARWTIGDVT